MYEHIWNIYSCSIQNENATLTFSKTTYIHTCIHTYTYFFYIHTYINTYIHTYIHTYIWWWCFVIFVLLHEFNNWLSHIQSHLQYPILQSTLHELAWTTRFKFIISNVTFYNIKVWNVKILTFKLQQFKDFNIKKLEFLNLSI